jgi:hypothetical protein
MPFASAEKSALWHRQAFAASVAPAAHGAPRQQMRIERRGWSHMTVEQYALCLYRLPEEGVVAPDKFAPMRIRAWHSRTAPRRETFDE